MTKKKKPKIAFFHCAFVYSGGGERIALEGVLGLRKRGYKVDLYAPAIDWENCYPDLLKKAKPKLIIPQLPEWFPLRHALVMGTSSLLAPFMFFKFKKYDLFIGENQPGVFFAWVYARIFKKPYIIYLNQPNRMIYPRAIDLKTGWFTNINFVFLEKAIWLFKPMVRFLDRVSIKNSNVMTVNGKYIGEIISQIYGKDYTDCPAGCDPFPHKKLKFSKSSNGILAVNGFKIKKPYILLTNRHYPQKRFDYAIKVLPKVLKKHPDIKLVITGAFTPATDNWKQLAVKLKVEKNIMWLGEVKNVEMSKLYENAYVYVYTSPEEDYGMGVVEAQEFGIPVVAWNNAGPTVTVKDGETGFLAKTFDISSFAEGVINLLDNPHKRLTMGKNAHSHVQKNFTWKRHVEILEKSMLASLSLTK